MKTMFLLLLLVSCSLNGDPESKLNTEVTSSKDLEENRSMIGVDMIGLNARLRAILLREEKYKDFSGFTSDVYVKKMLQYQEPSEKEYIDYMSSKDIQIVLVGKEKKFAICTKSIKRQLVFCDNSYSAELEFSDTKTDIDLNTKIKEYI